MEHSNPPTDANTPRGVVNRVKDTATAQLSSQKNRATDGLGSLASAVRETSRPLRDNKHDAIAEYVEKAADQLEHFSTRLRERDLNELVGDVRHFAHQRPALFIGAAFVAGAAAARFLKSSSDRTDAMQRYNPDDSRGFGSMPSAPGYTNPAGYTGGGL
jgi:hypothetical protein